MLKRLCWLVVIFMAMTVGCSSVEKNNIKNSRVSLNTALFSLEPVVSEQELFSLSKSQQQRFLKFYHLQTTQGYLPHEAVERFLQSNLGNFTYYGKTYIASKAMSDNSYGIPPTRLPIPGSPQDIASISALGSPSVWLG